MDKEEEREFKKLTKQNDKLREKLALNLTELTPKEQNKVFKIVNQIVNNEVEQESYCNQ